MSRLESFEAIRARQREHMLKAQNDVRRALLHHHSLQGDYMKPSVGAKLSIIAQRQEEELAAFDHATDLARYALRLRV